MNDTDVTGPLPVIPAEVLPSEEPSHGPVGWITEANRRAEQARSAPAEPAETAAAPADPLGPDPDLAFDFASEPPAAAAAAAGAPLSYEAGPEDTTAIPVVPALEVLDEAPPPQPPPPQPPSKSRHGQPAPLSRAWNAGIAAAIAVAVVVVGIVAFNEASSSPKPAANGAGPAFVLPTANLGAQGGVVTPSSPPGLDALPKASASTGASAGTTPASGVPVDAPSITVLNETTTHGLAATEAARLRSAGWTVRRVTNIRARLAQTTVYYDASQEAAAKALVAAVPSVKVALPRPSYVLSTGGLIVVVAADAA